MKIYSVIILILCISCLSYGQDFDYSYGYYVIGEDSIEFRKTIHEYGLWGFRLKRDVKPGEMALSGIDGATSRDLYKEERTIWENHSMTHPDSLNIVQQVYPFDLSHSEFRYPNSREVIDSIDILKADIEVSELFKIAGLSINKKDLLVRMTLEDNLVTITKVQEFNDSNVLIRKTVSFELTKSGSRVNFKETKQTLSKRVAKKLKWLIEKTESSENLACPYYFNEVFILANQRYFFSIDCKESGIPYSKAQEILSYKMAKWCKPHE